MDKPVIANHQKYKRKDMKKMNEIITTGGVSYTATNVTTGVDSISFDVINMTADEAKGAFRDVTSLTVGDENNEAYGKYPDIKLESVTEYEDGRIVITMHILSETERDIRDLKISQTEQDEVLAELLYGGNNNE